MTAAEPPPRNGIPAPFTFSQSSLQDYADCPRRFQLRYMDQLTWPAVEAEPVSEVEARQRDALLFHRMIQQRLLGIPDWSLTGLAGSVNTARWWQSFLQHGPALDGHAVHTEAALAAPVGRHRIVAKYDCIAVQPGRAVIFDWKTYARRPGEEVLAARWQTRVYRALLVRAGAELNGGRPFVPSAVSIVYWFAEFPTEPVRLTYDESQFKRDWSAIESLVHEIDGATAFPLTEDHARCRFCAFRSLCDRGGSAGDWHDLADEGASGIGHDGNLEQIGEIDA